MIGRTLGLSPGLSPTGIRFGDWPGGLLLLMPLLLLRCTRDCTSVPPYLPPVSLHWARYLTDPPAWPATPMTGGGDGDGFSDLWAPAIEPPCRLSSLDLQSTPAPRPRSCSCPRRRGLTASGLSEHEHHLHRSLVIFPKLQGWWWPHGWKCDLQERYRPWEGGFCLRGTFGCWQSSIVIGRRRQRG